jgi:hypothetical protein
MKLLTLWISWNTPRLRALAGHGGTRTGSEKTIPEAAAGARGAAARIVKGVRAPLFYFFVIFKGNQSLKRAAPLTPRFRFF